MQTAMIQALQTLKTATGVVQGHSVAELHNRERRDLLPLINCPSSVPEPFAFQNKQGRLPGRGAVNPAVRLTSTHTVLSTQGGAS